MMFIGYIFWCDHIQQTKQNDDNEIKPFYSPTDLLYFSCVGHSIDNQSFLTLNFYVSFSLVSQNGKRKDF